MAPNKASQLSSQWQTSEEKETQSEKIIRKSKEQPFIPIGKFSIDRQSSLARSPVLRKHL
jgi:hypothetical protein